MLGEVLSQIQPTTLRQATLFAAAMLALNTAIVVHYLLEISKAQGLSEKQLNFLADVVFRNWDKLDEFDIMALRELGITMNEGHPEVP